MTDSLEDDNPEDMMKQLCMSARDAMLKKDVSISGCEDTDGTPYFWFNSADDEDLKLVGADNLLNTVPTEEWAEIAI